MAHSCRALKDTDEESVTVVAQSIGPHPYERCTIGDIVGASDPAYQFDLPRGWLQIELVETDLDGLVRGALSSLALVGDDTQHNIALEATPSVHAALLPPPGVPQLGVDATLVDRAGEASDRSPERFDENHAFKVRVLPNRDYVLRIAPYLGVLVPLQTYSGVHLGVADVDLGTIQLSPPACYLRGTFSGSFLPGNTTVALDLVTVVRDAFTHQCRIEPLGRAYVSAPSDGFDIPVLQAP